MKIAFIGGGAMAEAMLSAILDKGISTPQAVSVSDIDDARRQHLSREYGVAVVGSNLAALNGRDVVVLAIKPQNVGVVVTELDNQIEPDQLVLSIVAGAKVNTLSRGLSHGSIVRVMPNTPARIGEGMSVWTATSEVTRQQREWAASIIGAMGKEIYVDDEKYIDMATAVSGSGPAYVFLIIESLVEAAVDIGLPRGVAEELVLQTVLGSGHFLQQSARPPADLRRMVTSPGGTTEAALSKLEEGGFSGLLKQAVVAAYKRARELGA